MNSFYIYAYQYDDVIEEMPTQVSATVIFCSCDDIDEADLQSEIRGFYEQHYQTDQIFIIGSNLNVPRLVEVFITNQNETFKGIPKRQDTHLNDSLFLLSFNKDGDLTCEDNRDLPSAFIRTFINEGLQQIFISRGGLIVSEASHHYVFPSGKHCDRFLRTGNILLYSPEIFFIAFSLLKHFNESVYTRIYCDTSSINSIAFALFDLKNSFLEKKTKVSIESFSSYEGLYKQPGSYTKDSFLLISASTSANIIKYILDKHTIIDRDNIVILYFLAGQSEYSNVKDQVLCNLTKSEQNPTGISYYPTYTEKNCEFCKKGSYAVPVSGDVFLLEKPKINKILLTANDREKGLSAFVKQFRSVNKDTSVLKASYKENSSNKYEVYIDYSLVLKNINVNSNYKNHKEKLNHYIQQYIPSNSKYFLALNDEGSIELTQYIFGKVAPYYTSSAVPVIINQDNLQSIDSDATGSIVVVGSCISNGKNLLYISRALRKYSKLRILYFIGIARTSNKDYLATLKSNLTRGRYGQDTNGFFTVEVLYCSNNSKNSPWIVEIEFLKDIIFFIQNEHPEFSASLSYFDNRKQVLLDKSGDVERGINRELFFERITTSTPETLELRKNFAFWDFTDYDKDVTQSDVYFTISNIINSLRNSEKVDKQLKQAVYVRNLLAPINFNRFNDGIIQASILRAANADELAYSVDPETSQEMYNFLETIITYHEQEQGEALMEFLYAIAIKKLSLSRGNLQSLLETVNKSCKHEFFLCMAAYIHLKLIDEPALLKSKLLRPVENSSTAAAV